MVIAHNHPSFSRSLLFAQADYSEQKSLRDSGFGKIADPAVQRKLKNVSSPEK